MSARTRTLLKDCEGAALVEFALVVPAFLLLLFGGLDMSKMFYERNAATKAIQYGARLAAVSSPVATGLGSFSGVTEDILPGDPLPDNSFDTTCTANEDASTVTCTNEFGGSSDAFRRILFGEPDRIACDPDASAETRGMCNFFDRLRGDHIVIRYEFTGLGYAGRPGGAVPTITVSMQTMQYDFFALDILMGFAPLQMPAFATTVTGEDLNLSWASG